MPGSCDAHADDQRSFKDHADITVAEASKVFGCESRYEKKDYNNL